MYFTLFDVPYIYQSTTMSATHLDVVSGQVGVQLLTLGGVDELEVLLRPELDRGRKALEVQQVGGVIVCGDVIQSC